MQNDRPKWNMDGYYTPPPKIQSSLWKKGQTACKDQRWWMTTRNQCLLDTEGQLHMSTHGDCDNMYNICANLNRHSQFLADGKERVSFILECSNW